MVENEAKVTVLVENRPAGASFVEKVEILDQQGKERYDNATSSLLRVNPGLRRFGRR
jgi:hypothetical protein